MSSSVPSRSPRGDRPDRHRRALVKEAAFDRWRPRWGWVLLASLWLAGAVAFWWFRIYAYATDPDIGLGPVDLYIEYIPMVEHTLREMRQGRMALWNPFQFCGLPLFAVGWTGALYPPQLASLWMDAIALGDWLMVLHLWAGGISMYLLARRLGAEVVGAAVASFTFAWSGFVISHYGLPGVLSGMLLMPLFLLAIDLVLDARRFAWLGLVLLVGCLVLNGATEVLVHTFYAGAWYTVYWYGTRAARGEWSVGPPLRVLACVVAGVLLGAVQLLPSIEMVGESTRAPGSISFAKARYASVFPHEFMISTVEARGHLAMGVIPLLAWPFLFVHRKSRFTVGFALPLAIAAALLSFGGWLFWLYFNIPVLGSLFRRPMKFLDMYVLAAGLLVAFGVDGLWEAIRERGTAIWRSVAWWACLVSGVAAAVWIASLGRHNPYLLPCLGLLVLAALVPRRDWKTYLLLAALAVHGAASFERVGSNFIRPLARPQIYESHDRQLAKIKEAAGRGRVYISPRYYFAPGLMAKQGQWQEMKVITDYEPLAPARYATFFERVSKQPVGTVSDAPFFGLMWLGKDMNVRLLDLTATRYYLVAPGEAAETFMKKHPKEFRLFRDNPTLRVYERSTPPPRVRWVPGATLASDGAAALDMLASGNVDVSDTVVLENAGAVAPASSPGGEKGFASIEYDGLSLVTVKSHSPQPGYVVLADLHFPGWTADIDGAPAEIHVANYLFRAVRVPAGEHLVTFRYEPASFRIGSTISIAVLLALAVLAAFQLRRP